ncbi:MAG TPA: hypothetical protein VGF65_02155, partial [Mycobacterium sp.]
MRTYATSAPYEATPSAQIRTSRQTNPQVRALQRNGTHHSDKSQVSPLLANVYLDRIDRVWAVRELGVLV